MSIARCATTALLACAALGHFAGEGAGQLVRFTRFGLEDGLSQANATALVQDVDGFLWVGTQNGLNRFDGISFRSDWTDGSEVSPVSYGLVRSLFSDSRGRLWVGMQDRGLHLFDRFRGVFRPVPFQAADGSPRDPPPGQEDFAQVGDDVLVATSEGLGILAWDSAGPTARLRDARVEGCGSALTALWAAGDTLWLGTRDGCVIVDPGSRGRRGVRVARTGVEVMEIAPGPEAAVHVATDGRGLLVFDRDGRLRSPGTPARAPHPREQVRAVLTTTSGDTWIGTSGGLGWRRSGRTETQWFTLAAESAGGLPHSTIDRLYEDRSGVLWIGTWNGLARLSPFYGGIGFIPLPATGHGEPVGGVVSIMREGPRHLLTGSIGGAVALVDRFGATSQPEAGAPPMGDIRSMALDGHGDLWVATIGSGVQRRTDGGWRAYRAGIDGMGSAPEDDVESVLVDRSGTLWAGGRTLGLSRYYPSEDCFRKVEVREPSYGLAESYVWPIREDGSGALWFGKNGTPGGIFRLGPDRQSLDFFETSGPGGERANTGRVLTLHLSGDTLVWFGTQGGGLGRLDPRTREIRFFTTRDGLPHDNVEGILEDRSGKLWVSTNLGLARFDPSTEEFWVFLEGSGIQFFRFFANSAYEAPDDLLYFGGPNGITVIDPDRVVPRRQPPPVALVRFLVDGVERPAVTHLSAQAGLELGSRENFFSFEFAALDFTEPQGNRYRYQLEGFEDAWVEAGTERSARYTGVRPGSYTFRVQARNGEGAWNSSGLAIPVRVRPPLTATSWFRGLAATLLAGVAFGIFVYRRRQLERVRAMRFQIAAELHDDIGANLSAIALKSDLIRRVARDGTRRESGLVDIQRLAQDTMHKVREMIWVVREENDTIQGLLTRMEDALGTLLGGVIDFTFTVEPGVPKGRIKMEDREDAYRVFKEAVQNAMKHAAASSVAVAVAYRRPELHVRVSDDGRGFLPDEVETGTGLKLMRLRDERRSIRVSVVSAPGAGTTVALTVRARP